MELTRLPRCRGEGGGGGLLLLLSRQSFKQRSPKQLNYSSGLTVSPEGFSLSPVLIQAVNITANYLQVSDPSQGPH